MADVPTVPRFAELNCRSLQVVISALLIFSAAGCGTAVNRMGTEQLLLSDSVDRAIDQLDLSPLAGRNVFLDTEYMRPVKGTMFINAEYITSALRQKMTTSGITIAATKDKADYVLEARVGALGADSAETTYGIPSSSGVGKAAAVLSGAPAAAASFPEISFGKRNGSMAVSKVVVFAYHKETGAPVWQSGNAVAKSDVVDSYFLGMGPMTKGSLMDGYKLGEKKMRLPFQKQPPPYEPKPLTIAERYNYVHPAVLEKQLADAKELEASAVQPASHEAAGTSKVEATPAPVPPVPDQP